MSLPREIEHACTAIFTAHPLDRAMPRLVGSDPKHEALVEAALQDPALCDRPDLAAGLWLYVDDLDSSHTVSQGIATPAGSFWHGIMHRREGDFSNSLYWMRRAEGHPLFAELDPASLVQAVSRAAGRDDPALVERQRKEWLALFTWCAGLP